MKLEIEFESRWDILVDQAYLQNENFNYIKVKKLVKDIKSYERDILRTISEVETTLKLTKFNDNLQFKEDLEKFLDYANNKQIYLHNLTKLEPRSKQGYYNYLKNMMGYI